MSRPLISNKLCLISLALLGIGLGQAKSVSAAEGEFTLASQLLPIQEPKSILLAFQEQSSASHSHTKAKISSIPSIKNLKASKKDGRSVNYLPGKTVPISMTSERLQKLKSMAYEEATFNTLYQSFMFNGHTTDAYLVASIAVEKRPNDLAWHERLAQTATWAGNYSLGLKEWLYVSHKTNNMETLRHAISVAKTLGYYGVLEELLKIYQQRRPNDPRIDLELAAVENANDKPDAAMASLVKYNAIHPSRESLVMLAKLYEDTGNYNGALQAWKKLDVAFGPSAQAALAEASIYYNRTHFSEAFLAMKRAIHKVSKKDEDFWAIWLDLAWALNDKSAVVLGLSNNLNTASNLMGLIQFIQADDPQKAMQYSWDGFNRFHTDAFFDELVYLAQSLNRWDTLLNLYKNMSESQRHRAMKTKVYWSVLLALYQHYSDEQAQRNFLIAATEAHPELVDLKSALLWMVMGNGETLNIKQFMQEWYEQNQLDNPKLWHASAEAFGVLNKYFPAMLMYQDHLFRDETNTQLIIDYASLIERAQLFHQARRVRRSLWSLLTSRVNNTEGPDKETLRSLIQVAPYFASGTTQVSFLDTLIEGDMNDEDLNVVLNWLVPRSYFSAVTYYKYTYLKSHLPDWAAINLALWNNDRQSLQTIMEHTERGWTRSDRINAAVRLENIPLALDLAYNELAERPKANEIYTEFEQYGIQNAQRFRIGEEYEQFVNVAGPRTKLEGRVRLTNSLKLVPYVDIWNLRSKNQTQITNVPSVDALANFRLEQKIHRGQLNYNLGWRNAMKAFAPVSLDGNYELNSKLTGITKLGFNQENFIDPYLRVGGVQDQADLGLLYAPGPRDLVSASIQGLNYYSQDRHYLGDGYNVFTSYQRKLFHQYPDYTVGVFGNLYNFRRNGSFAGTVARLFPTPDAAILADPNLLAALRQSEYQQVIPNNYREGGLMFSFGDKIIEYSHRFRPYFWGSLYYNSLTRLSYMVKAGINGTVLGRDSLLIYGEYGTAPTIANQSNIVFGARYSMYF